MTSVFIGYVITSFVLIFNTSGTCMNCDVWRCLKPAGVRRTLFRKPVSWSSVFHFSNKSGFNADMFNKDADVKNTAVSAGLNRQVFLEMGLKIIFKFFSGKIQEKIKASVSGLHSCQPLKIINQKKMDSTVLKNSIALLNNAPHPVLASRFIGALRIKQGKNDDKKIVWKNFYSDQW